jgi:hypothetical protein
MRSLISKVLWTGFLGLLCGISTTAFDWEGGEQSKNIEDRRSKPASESAVYGQFFVTQSNKQPTNYAEIYSSFRRHFTKLNPDRKRPSKLTLRFKECFSSKKEFDNLRPYFAQDYKQEFLELGAYMAALKMLSKRDMGNDPKPCEAISFQRTTNTEYSQKAWALKEKINDINQNLLALQNSSHCQWTLPWKINVREAQSHLLADLRNLTTHLDELNDYFQARSELISSKWSEHSCSGAAATGGSSTGTEI